MKVLNTFKKLCEVLCIYIASFLLGKAAVSSYFYVIITLQVEQMAN